ncbi:MAG: amidoligase family protein [Clostridia bacterium]|nr:amidoligase family protein [Clostridia bacterium]
MNKRDTKALIGEKLLNLSEYDRIELIKKIDDVEYIKKYIESNSEKLYSDDLVDLVGLTRDAEYVKKWLNNDKTGLDEVQNMRLLLSTKDEKLMNSYLEENREKLSKEERNLIELNLNPDRLKSKGDVRKSLQLPEDMTIGIEIESEGQFSKLLPSKIMGWDTKAEDSLYNGIEVVSPPLTATEDNVKQIYSVCDVLNGIGQTTTEKCAAHIHIGANYLKSKQAYINLLEIIGNTEYLIYIISNKPGENLREGISEYSLPISKKLEDAFENNKISLNDENVENFIADLKSVQGNRYSGINFNNVNTEKNTIELRTANGTIDPDVWIENVNLFGGIIKASQELAELQAKKMRDLTMDECIKIGSFERLKSDGVDKKEKLDLLLSLTVKEKAPYMQRYEVNKSLVEDDFYIDEILQDAKLDKSFDVRRIAKTLFSGKDAIRGEEIRDMEKQFYLDIEKSQGLDIDEIAI